jgi:hypothetical protein
VVARLGPGSPEPRNPAEVEALLRMVPVVAFMTELEALVPAPLGAAPLTPAALTEALTEAADAADAALSAWLARVVEALGALQVRAEAEANGGLRFLAGTLRHFLEVERIPAAEHPLVVALFARTDARRRGAPDHPNEVARVLDGW